MKFVWQGLISNCNLCPFTCELLLYREQRILTINLQVKCPIATHFNLVAFYSSLYEVSHNRIKNQKCFTNKFYVHQCQAQIEI